MALKTKIIVQQILNIDDITTTASKYPKYTVVLGTSISSITASELTAGVEASAASAAAAKDSEIAAKESETNAKDSENLSANYANSSEASATQSATSATEAERQAGLSKDSADASATSAEESKGFRDSAELAAQDAEQSRLLAEQAKKDAEAAKTAAATSEQNAAVSATESTNQATAATGSATKAGEYATTAKDSEIAAKTSELNAKDSEHESAISAEASEASASQSAISASQSAASATKAAESSAAAKTSEINAKTSETNAKTSETNAAAYAAAAKTSETNAAASAASASDSKGFRDEAEAFAAQASTSALAAKNSEINTKTSEINSKASEDAAKLAQQSASGSANTATQAMTTTKGYRDEAEVFKNTATTAATTATDKALEAAGSATIAGEKATNATSAADRAETAAASAEQVMQASLKKDQNLNDLANKDLAREALKVEAVNSVKDQYAGAYNSFRNPAWTYELRIANNGEWRVARNDNNSTSALSIGAGGTGAENVAQARINFQVNRFNQGDGETFIQSPDTIKYLTVGNDGWGYWNTATQQFVPLGIQQGGTGATSDVGARKNLNTPVGGQAIAIPDTSNILGFMSTYAESGYYSSGELVTYQPPEASGWWMYELHVHRKNANGHVEYGNIVATTMNGNKWGIICNNGSWGGWYRIARSDKQLMLLSPDAQSALGDYSIAIGDHDSGLKWDRDGHISAFADSARIFAWTPSGINTYRVISSYADDYARGMYVNGVRRGDPNALIAGQVEGGAFADWRSRASGLLVEHTGFDSAVAIFKSVYWGKDWIAGMDVVPWTSGGAETHLYVKGAEFIFDSAGNGSASNWVSRSDIRLKAHLKEIETASDKIDYLTGYTYYKRNNLIEDENSVYSIEAGLIAQDVERVLPEAVHSLNNDGQLDPKGEAIKGINYNGVVALLVNAFKEQKAKIDNQQEEINVLRNELYELKNLVKSMLNGNAPTITELP